MTHSQLTNVFTIVNKFNFEKKLNFTTISTHNVLTFMIFFFDIRMSINLYENHIKLKSGKREYTVRYTVKKCSI